LNSPELDISREQGPFAAEADQQVNIHEYIQLILGKWRLITAICLLVLAVAVVKYFLEPKLYRATTVLQIEQRSPLSMNSRDWDPWLAAWAQAKYYPTQYRLLQSRGLAERVVLNLRLADDPKFNPGRAQLPAGEEAVTAAADAAMIAGLAQRILGGLNIRPTRDTELVEISYVSPDPELAARIANGLVDAFIDWGSRPARRMSAKPRPFSPPRSKPSNRRSTRRNASSSSTVAAQISSTSTPRPTLRCSASSD